MSTTPGQSVLLRSITTLPPGTLMVMFGSAAELVAVDPDPCPGFPGARMLTIRPADGGLQLSVLVPADFIPVVLPRSAR